MAGPPQDPPQPINHLHSIPIPYILYSQTNSALVFLHYVHKCPARLSFIWTLQVQIHAELGFSQEYCLWLSSPSVALRAPTLTPPSASPDDTNIVRESTEIVDVSPSITTNVIGQKTDEVGPDMCERSCEELSAMFQELNGLRVIVSNLIDGLQKVVSWKCVFLPRVCFYDRWDAAAAAQRKPTFQRKLTF